ncbi:hypothetical protein yc1106_06100 [Curvularia clavata]|uniref:RING-type domain-containing protein n=1 Tax=Curvularia clavata TaxID=95742 RepID=A0A9Q8ZAT7_CURCL|nr:hypothetical protein yc1106_06100 [Curvularia clavata]
MAPSSRNEYFGDPPSPSSVHARSYPFRVRSPLPTAWNARHSRPAAGTPSPGSVSRAGSPIPRITALEFVEKYTKPAPSRASKGACPICLDGYSTEECLQITGIAGCRHRIGVICLKDMLKHHPMEEKKCPLCRTVWIPGDSPASTPPQMIRRHSLAHTANALRAINDVPRDHRQEASSIESSDMSFSGNESFRTQTGETAEIRRQAENMQYHRRVRRRHRQLESLYAENRFGPSSDDRAAEPTKNRTSSSETYTAAMNVFDRIRNARARNPFRPATSETVPSAAAMGEHVHRNDTRGDVARAQRQPSARVSELRGISGAAETNTRQNSISSASTNDSPAPTCMASPEASAEATTAPSDYQLLYTRHWYDTVSHRQCRLDQREEMLDAREEVLNGRLRSVVDWEADIREREDRLKHTLDFVKRQRNELEELLRRQKEALERFLE